MILAHGVIFLAVYTKGGGVTSGSCDELLFVYILDDPEMGDGIEDAPSEVSVWDIFLQTFLLRM